VRAKIRSLTDRKLVGWPIEAIVAKLNRSLRGSAAYFRHGNSARKFDEIDRYVHEHWHSSSGASLVADPCRLHVGILTPSMHVASSSDLAQPGRLREPNDTFVARRAGGPASDIGGPSIFRFYATLAARGRGEAVLRSG
jgi:hypothetical protein